MTQDTPRAALDAGIDAARLADPVVTTRDNREFVFIPHGYGLEEKTDPYKLPPAIKQGIEFDDRDSLTIYVNRFHDDRSILVADYDAARIQAHLDWHEHNQMGSEPAHNMHSASLALRDSEEFARWNGMEGQMHAQDDFAMFIEENVADVINPNQSDLLGICRDLEATQGVSFKGGVRLDNGDRTFVYSTETQVKGNISVPTEITLSIPLYHGEEPADVRAKFRFKATDAGLLLGFRWHRVEFARQATFRQMATKVCEDTGLPLMFGRAKG